MKHVHIRKSECYTLFLDGSTLFKKQVFHLAFSLLGVQANRDSPCQNQLKDTHTQQRLSSLARVFAVGSLD